VTGPIVAHLWVSSDRPDTDITIKLVDVYPPSADYPQGFAMNLTDGILRLRYRQSWEAPRPLERGKSVRVKIEAFPTGNVFVKGHRIRLDVSSSNFPRFDVNPNTGEPEARATTMAVARSGRIEARTGLRMMPTSPRSPLSAGQRVFPSTAGRLAYQAGPTQFVFQLTHPSEI
jgi:putative CocE/NonD family hydrolase